MTARRLRSAGTVRSIGAVAERGTIPQSAPRLDARYVALDRMREQIDRVEWAPLRLSTAARVRPASPRVPHALLLHLAHAARVSSASAPLTELSLADASLADVPVALDVGTLAGLVGTDEAGVGAALRALLRAGALDVGTSHAVGVSVAELLPATVTLAPALLGPAPRCAALDWGALALATAGAPSAWVAAHVLAERLVLDEWTPMPRSALEHTLGCGVSGVRSALERLTAVNVVERREQRGGVSAYRFSPAMRTADVRGQGGGVPRQAPRVVTPSAPVAAPATGIPLTSAPLTSAPLTSAPLTGVRLTVGGVELDVPAGLRVRVDIGADGTPQITLVPAAAPPG